jgi:hypothetical protein
MAPVTPTYRGPTLLTKSAEPEATSPNTRLDTKKAVLMTVTFAS